MKKKWQTGQVQKKVIKMYHAQNGLCGYCGTPNMFLRADVSKKFFQSNKHLRATFDHIVARTQGGTFAFSNGVCVCSRCNTIKANLSLEEFFEQYDELYQKLIEKPQRIAARRRLVKRKNGYIIAWFAKLLNKTVEDMFLEHVYDTTYDMIRNDTMK